MNKIVDFKKKYSSTTILMRIAELKSAKQYDDVNSSILKKLTNLFNGLSLLSEDGESFVVSHIRPMRNNLSSFHIYCNKYSTYSREVSMEEFFKDIYKYKDELKTNCHDRVGLDYIDFVIDIFEGRSVIYYGNDKNFE